MTDEPCTVHSEDALIRELYEAKLGRLEQRLNDFMVSSEKAASHVAVELDRRLHETNGFKEEMSKQVAQFITRREAISLMTLIAVVVGLVAGLVGKVVS